jgi:hypothetical protein
MNTKLKVKYECYTRRVIQCSDGVEITTPWELKVEGYNLTLNGGLDTFFNGTNFSSFLSHIALGNGTTATQDVLLNNVTVPITVSGTTVTVDVGIVLGTNTANRLTIDGTDTGAARLAIQGRVTGATGTVWTIEVERTIGTLATQSLTLCTVRRYFTNRTALGAQVVQSNTLVSGENTNVYQASPSPRIAFQRSILFPVEVANQNYTEAGWRNGASGAFFGITVLPAALSVPIGFQAKIIVIVYHYLTPTTNVAVANFGSGYNTAGTFQLDSNDPQDYFSVNGIYFNQETGTTSSSTLNALISFRRTTWTEPTPLSITPSSLSIATNTVVGQTCSAGAYVNGTGYRQYTGTLSVGVGNGDTIHGFVIGRSFSTNNYRQIGALKLTTPYAKTSSFQITATFEQRVTIDLLA